MIITANCKELELLNLMKLIVEEKTFMLSYQQFFSQQLYRFHEINVFSNEKNEVLLI